MSKTVKFIRNSLLAVIAALSIRACMLYTEDITNKYGRQEEIINRYNGQSISYIQNSAKTLKSAQKIAEAVYGLEGNCSKGAGLIAYLLKDDGYSQKFVKLEKNGWGFHWFFMHESKDKIYFADNGLFGIVKCNSVEELKDYVEHKDKIKGLTYKITEEMPLEFEPEKVREDIRITACYNKTQRHLN